jgi:hypothetical protein
MRKEDVFLAYKLLVEMRNLADILEKSLADKDIVKANEAKQKLIELQRRLDKVL